MAFDDTVLDHNSSFKMESVRRQYSGNAHAIIKGIGVVTCVYINPELGQFWIIDYRIYDRSTMSRPNSTMCARCSTTA